ncbi:MAG TPA: hypothetical protein VEL76_39755 [Gemmataceae bacterium]|nr:hypothetical protein [Gemmataceae bacterium]
MTRAVGPGSIICWILAILFGILGVYCVVNPPHTSDGILEGIVILVGFGGLAISFVLGVVGLILFVSRRNDQPLGGTQSREGEERP